MLAPSGTPLDPVEDETFEGSEGEEPSDGKVPMSASLDPSSIGISFAIEKGADPVRVVMRWGEYEKVERADEVDVADSVRPRRGPRGDRRADQSDERCLAADPTRGVARARRGRRLRSWSRTS